jgi:hypothetical protein
MLASAFSAFAPSALPEAAAANANLYVSAENPAYQNQFGGPQVIEVVVNDPDLSDTDVQEAEPDVTLNGKDLRMVQTTDGSWVGYFADRSLAQTADQTVADNTAYGGTGLDFGLICSPTSMQKTLNITNNDITAFTLPVSDVGGANGTTSPLVDCATKTTGLSGNQTLTNVVREPKEPVAGSSSPVIKRGGIGIQNYLVGRTDVPAAHDLWPFIQLYDFNPDENIVVNYAKSGSPQSVTININSGFSNFSKLDSDRTTYPQGANVHLTITDPILNVDPTDEDVWAWGTNSTNSTGIAIVYQPFDENGNAGTSSDLAGSGAAVNGKKGLTNIKDSLGSLNFETTGLLKINYDAQGSGTKVLRITDTGDNIFVTGAGGATSATSTTLDAARVFVPGAKTSSILGNNTAPVTFTEYGSNTGIFGNYDNGDNSDLVITNGAKRGTSATIDYNEVGKTILVGFGFAAIDIQPTDAEWNSGEEIPVSLTDTDANKNSRADEDLDLFNPDVTLIPSLTLGDPFTLGENDDTTSPSTALSGVATSLGVSLSNTGAGPVYGLTNVNGGTNETVTVDVDKFSKRAVIGGYDTVTSVKGVVIDLEATAKDLRDTFGNTRSDATTRLHGFNLLNLDTRSISTTGTVDVFLLNGTQATVFNVAKLTGGSSSWNATKLAIDANPQSLTLMNGTAAYNGLISAVYNMDSTDKLALWLNFSSGATASTSSQDPIVADVFSFGYFADGLKKENRVNNMIDRLELEETGDNTSVFGGSLEYIALNQLNILDSATYTGLSTIADDPTFIVNEDLDDEESPRVSYNDKGGDGVTTQVSDQEAAGMHSGSVSFDKPTYKIADTVTVTLEDQDLNTDSDLIDIYTSVDSTTDAAGGTIGKASLPSLSDGTALGRLLDITFDDTTWRTEGLACDTTLGTSGIDTGLVSAGFTLKETGSETGIFTGDFQVPSQVCHVSDANGGDLTTPKNTQGLDMEVNYVDFRDASGQTIEVGDGAGIRANTGSVSLDRTVYPVPWGVLANFDGATTLKTPDSRSIFPVHLTGIGTTGINSDAKTLGDGALTIHVDVNDPDFDVSATGEDKIASNVTSSNFGPVKVSVSRSADTVVLAYAGGDTVKNGVIDVDDDAVGTSHGGSNIRQLGPITETAPSSGIFEFDLDVLYTDGPASSACPNTKTAGYNSLTSPGTLSTYDSRFDKTPSTGDYCIIQGDIITVEYTDPADASGEPQTVTDSATFDLRNGALQSDKSVYIIGSDMILTLIEPDFDLDNDLAETYDLDLIEWDSDAATTTMGDLGGAANAAAFDPEPSDFRETGDSTGIFQSVIEIPRTLSNDNLERGEEIVLEYTDWGPSGADYVGSEDEDVNLTIFTSNFGATVELDQKVYTWTDKVYITIVAPDHNFDSNLVDQIGTTAGGDPLQVATRGHKLTNYKLVETGTDTGIFTGEVILTGFNHDSTGTSDGTAGTPPHFTGNAPGGATSGLGPTDGFLEADDDDGVTVSYEFSEDETVVGSALVRWNIGEVSWLEASYPASGTGVVRVIDPDMNLNPEAVDNFDVNVWSDSDSGGIDLTVTETNEATGIFEGTVSFTTTDSSSGHRLRVAEGDTVTAEYKDNTLPDPYTTSDELDITGTAFIGTIVPPLERAPASNARVVDAFGNTLDSVSVDQQVQITADLTNGQDREQAFAYLVQIQDEDGVTVSLAWITGSLTAGQSFSPALSWIPNAPGTYTATAFVWESVDNPTALSPPVKTTVRVV